MNNAKEITVGSFNEIIKKVHESKKLVPDLLKSENGNNFRSISESAILEVLTPILIESEWFYEVRVKKSDLQIREAFGSKGRKLQFIATVEVAVVFHNCLFPEEMVGTEAVGMGIDDNDKAMGKAYTYAVKYALLKLFRLRYGDDADFEASKPLYLEKPKEEKESKKVTTKEEETVKKIQKGSKKNTEQKDLPMTEKQRDYILGLMEKHNVTDEEMKNIYGYSPLHDEYIPMPKAREMIKWLEDGALPF